MQKLRNAKTALFSMFAVPLAMVSGAASAATGTPIDTAAVVAQYGQIETALVAVGAVIISAAALAVGFKWIKGMVFG